MTETPVDRIVVINDASTARGGATGLALLSLRLLRQRGYSVTYIVGDDGANADISALGVEIIATGGRQLVAENRIKAFAAGLYNTRARDVVAQWIATNDTPRTIYHVHGWSKILSPSIFSALQSVASRTLIHAHDFFLACPNGAYMNYPRNEPCNLVPLGGSCLSTNCDKRSYSQKLWRSARRGILSRTLDPNARWAGFAMIHEAMAPYLIKGGLPALKLTTVRNPVDPLSDDRIEAENNADVFFIGRVEAEKGIEDAIAAAAVARVPLKVIGDGPLRERLAAAHPEVAFLGWRSRDDMRKLIRTARALVMPSRYPEPFGLVAAEASRSGIPVLLPHTAFLSAEIVRFKIGLSCDTRSLVEFSDALVRLRDLPLPEIRDMSMKAFSNTANLAQSPEQWLQSLLELYGLALDSGKPH